MKKLKSDYEKNYGQKRVSTTFSIFGNSIFGIYYMQETNSLIFLTPRAIEVEVTFGDALPIWVDYAWTDTNKKNVLEAIFVQGIKLWDPK